MSKTNPIGRGKVNVSVTVASETDTELRRLAMASGVSRSRYCRTILVNAAERGVTIDHSTELKEAPKRKGSS